MGLAAAFFPAFSHWSKALMPAQTEPVAANMPEKSTVRAENAAFAHALVALSAKLAAVDGAVNAAELTAFTRLFVGDKLEDAGRLKSLFVKHLSDDSSTLQYARHVLNATYGRAGLHLELIERLLLAIADGKLNAAECEWLRAVAAVLHIDGDHFKSLLSRHVVKEGSPYEVLGVTPSVSDDELRAHYMVQVQKLHPDRYQAAGATPATIAMLSDQLAAINAAYDSVCRQRAKKYTRAFTSAGVRRNNKGVKAHAA